MDNFATGKYATICYMEGLLAFVLIFIWYGYPFLGKKRKRWKDIVIQQTGLLFFSPGIGINGLYDNYHKLKTEKARNTFFLRVCLALVYFFLMLFLLIKFIILSETIVYGQTERTLFSVVVIILSAIFLNLFIKNVKDKRS